MKQDRIARKLQELRIAIERNETLIAVRNGLIGEGAKAGMSLSKLGELAGVSKPRAQQIAAGYERGETYGARPGRRKPAKEPTS